MIDTEKALLGALLGGYPDLDEIAGIVTQQDFYQPLHGVIYASIHQLAATGIRPDPLTVLPTIGGKYPLPNGPLYLTDLLHECPVPATAPWYAAEVAKNAKRRLVAETGSRMTQLAEGDTDPDEMVNDALRWLTEQTASRPGQGLVSMADAIPAVIDIAEHGRRRGVSSPWADIDRLTRGFYPGRLYVIGARPGVGKSLFASNLAVHVAGKGMGVFVASMEMSRAEFAQRCASAEAHIDLGRLEEGGLNEDEWDRLARGTSRLATLPIDIADAETQSMAYIRACARAASRQHKLGMVVVDYLQMIIASDRKTPRQEQVAEISRSLKRLARELDVPVIALAQVNRASTQRKDARPTLADLRESGAIEADADCVILLHTPEDHPEEVHALIAKGRSTAKGEAVLLMQGYLSRLVPMQRGVPR